MGMQTELIHYADWQSQPFAVGARHATASFDNERSSYSAAQPWLSGAMPVSWRMPSEATSNGRSTARLLANGIGRLRRPSKPAQYRVYGPKRVCDQRPGYNAMVSLIRFRREMTPRHGRDSMRRRKLAAHEAVWWRNVGKGLEARKSNFPQLLAHWLIDQS